METPNWWPQWLKSLDEISDGKTAKTCCESHDYQSNGYQPAWTWYKVYSMIFYQFVARNIRTTFGQERSQMQILRRNKTNRNSMINDASIWKPEEIPSFGCHWGNWNYDWQKFRNYLFQFSFKKYNNIVFTFLGKLFPLILWLRGIRYIFSKF